MFNVLDEEDESERDERKYRSPEAEVASPDIFVVFDLERGLYCGRGDERSKGDLCDVLISSCWLGWVPDLGRVSYQFRVEVPVALHRLRRALPVQIPQRAGTSNNSKSRDCCDPNIQKARREVIANRADWAPTFTITA